MIAEPYICMKGSKVGTIEWFNEQSPSFVHAPSGIRLVLMSAVLSVKHCSHDEVWTRYADFEREKLERIRAYWIGTKIEGYHIYISIKCKDYWSGEDWFDYGFEKYAADSESNRLLKRAEFLKAVCEKEGVEWLPKTEDGFCPKCHYSRSWHGRKFCKEDGCGKGTIFEGEEELSTKAEEKPYTQAQINVRFNTLLDALKTRDKTVDEQFEEQREFQKALLDVLEGGMKEHYSEFGWQTAFSDLRSRFSL